MDRSTEPSVARRIGIALITFAIGFNLPYVWLASTFDYPAILRSPPGVVLAAFADGGAPLILAWAAFALAALLFAPIAIGVAMVTRRRGYPSSEVAALGIAAGVTQAIGLSRWVYAVPGLAASWVASADDAGNTHRDRNDLHDPAPVCRRRNRRGDRPVAHGLLADRGRDRPARASALRRRTRRRWADRRPHPAPRSRRGAGDRHSFRSRNLRTRRSGRLSCAHRLADMDGDTLHFATGRDA